METLKTLLLQADDDYLMGLSNKGIVKRAHKDLEQEAPVLTWKGEEAQVALKEETCIIRAPLGESSCSCPSRSICRHVVAAILWLQGELGKEEEEQPRVLEELLAIPAERLKRACGSRRYRQFLAHVQKGELPPLEESSIVTVTLPWEQVTVKLLEPLEYASCTCHSRELCAHKAQALLLYQIKHERCSLQDLEALQETEYTYDEVQIRQACEGVKEAVLHQLCTGLSRQSREASESLMRLAVISHRACLPKLESRLRKTESLYQQYFERSAAFREEELLKGLLSAFVRAKHLEEAKSQEEIRALAGAFREPYELVGQLHLMCLGARTFSSKTGYEGEIYYFLEMEQGNWYTWTDARPVYYEDVRRRPKRAVENAGAPWGLSCSREQLKNLEFELKGAKAAAGGRLSVSQETKGEILGIKNVRSDAVTRRISWDYEALLESFFGTEKEAEETERTGEEWADGRQQSGRKERLALIGAVRFGKSTFDSIQQRFSWSLYDAKGRVLYISLQYTKEERDVIYLLERLEKRLEKQTQGNLVFFGSLYLDQGRLCLYPIEFFQPDERMETSEAENAEKTEQWNSRNRILKIMEQYIQEASRQLADLFAGGLLSLQEETLDRIRELAEEGEHLGLHYAGEELSKIHGLLQEKRHQMEFSPEPVAEAMERLCRYFSVCRKKLSYDRAFLSMEEPVKDTNEEREASYVK